MREQPAMKLFLALTIIFFHSYNLSALAQTAGTLGVLSYSIENSAVTITDCDPSATEVSIPSRIEDTPVTQIGDLAFLQNFQLRSASIPEGVTAIGMGAFAECYNLETVSIPSSVTRIGDGAFVSCRSLKSLTLPEELQSLGAFALSQCIILNDVVIPKGITTLPDELFQRCNRLSTVTLPEGLINIGAAAFAECENLVQISIPTSVTSLGKQAFSSCFRLKTVNIPSGVTVIADEAFTSCNALEFIVIPQGVHTIGASAFSFCGFPSITLPSSVTSIGDRAFAFCESLFRVFFEGAAPTASNNAFFRGAGSILDTLFGLVTVVNGEHLETFGGEGVKWNGLEVVSESNYTPLPQPSATVDPFSVLSHEIVGDEVSITHCDETADGDLVIPAIIEGLPVTEIASNAFNSCTRLRRVTIPNGVRSIGRAAFLKCRSLEKVDLPATLNDIGRGAFESSGLKSLEIPSSVTLIDGWAFHGCTDLEQVSNSSRITSIYENTFAGCSSLSELEIPDTVTEIEERSFGACRNLEELKLPSGLTDIGDSAFAGCERLESLEIPSSVKTIGDSVFNGCHNLVGVDFPSETVIGKRLFLQCFQLEHVRLPTSALSLGGSMFQQCTKLETVRLPSGITCLGDAAFSGCVLLKELSLPPGVTKLGDTSLAFCPALERISLPASVECIGRGAFAASSNLSEIIFTGSVPTKVGSEPFIEISSEAQIRVSPEHLASFGGEGALWNGVPVTSTIQTSECIAEAYDLANLSGLAARPEVDPFQRGFENGIAYALGIPLSGDLTETHRARLPRIATSTSERFSLGFTIPQDVPDDVTYRVMASETLGEVEEDWVEIARKVGNQSWSGPAVIEESTTGIMTGILVYYTSTREESPRAFMRLLVDVLEK